MAEHPKPPNDTVVARLKSLGGRVPRPHRRSSSPQPTPALPGPSAPLNPPSGSVQPATAGPSPLPHSDPSRSLHNVTAAPHPYRLLLPSSLAPLERSDPPSGSEKMKEWGSAGWAALKDAFKIVEKVSGALPPLKAAVGALVVVMERIDVYAAFLICDGAC